MAYQLEPGMRVRCVDDTVVSGRKHSKLTHGREYLVLNKRGRNGCIEIRDDSGEIGGWYAERFKPIVRVKAPTSRLMNLAAAVDRATRHIFAGAGY